MYSCLGRELSITELFRIQDHCYTVNTPREKHAGGGTKPNKAQIGCLNSRGEKTAISILTSMWLIRPSSEDRTSAVQSSA